MSEVITVRFGTQTINLSYGADTLRAQAEADRAQSAADDALAAQVGAETALAGAETAQGAIEGLAQGVDSGAAPLLMWRDQTGFVGLALGTAGITGSGWSIGADGFVSDAFSVAFDAGFDSPVIVDANGFGRYLLPDTAAEADLATDQTASDERALHYLHAKLARRLEGEAVTAKIGLFGDSWIANGLIGQALADRLYALYGQGADGFLPAVSSPVLLNSATGTKNGTWTTADISEAPESGAYAPDGHRLDSTASTSGDSYVWANARGVNFHLYHLNTTGTFRWRVDGGAWTAVTGTGAGTPAKVSILGLSLGTHTIEVDLVGNTGTVSLLGLYATGISGAELSQFGNGSSKSDDIASIIPDTVSAYILADVALDAGTVVLGTNDFSNDRTPALVKTSQATIAGALQAAQANAGVLFASPPRNNRTGLYSMRHYADGAKENSAELGNVAFLDFTRLWGTWAVMNGAGVWLDDGHLNTAGSTLFAAQIFRKFLQLPA